MTVRFIQSPALAGLTLHIRHGFFGRLGGVSTGAFASLNVANKSGDDPANVAENRKRALETLGVGPSALVTVSQVHSAKAVTVDAPFPAGARPDADAIVTNKPGLALGVLTADCAPILICDPQAHVCAAVHAGWRGAVLGIVEAAVEQMVRLGAEPSRMVAAIGPCLSKASFEVGPDLVDQVLASTPWAESLVSPGEGDRSFFDLKAYLLGRMARVGLARLEALEDDTLAQQDVYFSHRGAQRQGFTATGRNLSAILLLPG